MNPFASGATKQEPPRTSSPSPVEDAIEGLAAAAAAYSRADVCEVRSRAFVCCAKEANLHMRPEQVEPTLISSIMRILLRYVIEIEATDVKGFTKNQLSTFISTLEVVPLL